MRMRFITLMFVVSIFMPGVYANPAYADIEQNQVAATILKAQRNNLEIQIDGDHWDMPAHLGVMFISGYYLMTRWLGRESPRLQTEILKQKLLDEQLSDGSWQQVKDPAKGSGHLDATIWNYWALKAMGENINSQPLSLAREFIRTQGGLEKAPTMTRIFLAMFGQESWEHLPNIPLFSLFDDWTTVSPLDRFAPWVGSHLMPYAYLRRMQLTKTLGFEFDIQELRNGPSLVLSRSSILSDRLSAMSPNMKRLIQKLLNGQRTHGSWGGFTVSSLLTIAVLDDYSRRFAPGRRDEIDAAIEHAIGFVEQRYFQSRNSSYEGVLEEGKVWDTVLIGLAMQESGYPTDQLQPVATMLQRYQLPSGGIPFGDDFEPEPDTDDTAEIIMFWRRQGLHEPADKATQWLISKQNQDGGWPAFFQNNEPSGFLLQIAGSFADSADLFDESEPDTTGHILEALAESGYTIHNSEMMRRGVAYLRAKFDPSVGGWLGRWGVGYIYGTNAAVIGMIRAGVSPQDPQVMASLNWLASVQNEDGGFGETTDVDKDKRLAGRGISTPSQTAWALMTFLEAGLPHAQTTERAVSYLLETFEKEGRWIDQSAVGTGHPGLLYMNYPSYPYAWPLMALSRYYRQRFGEVPNG